MDTERLRSSDYRLHDGSQSRSPCDHAYSVVRPAFVRGFSGVGANSFTRSGTEGSDGLVVELHLLSLSTGQRHPVPERGKLEHTFGHDSVHMLGWNHSLQICENLLCIHHERDMDDYTSDNLAIWDWKRGELVMVGDCISLIFKELHIRVCCM